MCGSAPTRGNDLSARWAMAIREESLLAARLRYKAACSALQSCVRSTSAAPCIEFLELEARALRSLTEARAKLLAAIAGSHNAYLAGRSIPIDDLSGPIETLDLRDGPNPYQA